MTDLQKEFEATGYTSWINTDLYPDGKIYTQEYTEWLEKQVQELRIHNILFKISPNVLHIPEGGVFGTQNFELTMNKHRSTSFHFSTKTPLFGICCYSQCFY